MKRKSTDPCALRGWIFLTGDVDWSGVSGTWCRKAPDDSWYALKFNNEEYSIGTRDFLTCNVDRYSCEVVRVVLSEISHESKVEALNSCGYAFEGTDKIVVPYSGDVLAETPERIELVLLECLIGYGTAQPLETFTDMHYPDRARGQARRYAESLMRDAQALRKTLDRPVNAIGTTAEEYGSGDALAGLRRFQESGYIGTPNMVLMSMLMGKV